MNGAVRSDGSGQETHCSVRNFIANDARGSPSTAAASSAASSTGAAEPRREELTSPNVDARVFPGSSK
jgi:hypothetical protein